MSARRESFPVHAGDMVRARNRRGAAWRRVLRVYRRAEDRAVVVVMRTSKEWRAIGAPDRQRLTWSFLSAFGVGVRRAAEVSR